MNIGKLKLWFLASRPFAFPASATPVVIGTAVAWVHVGTFNLAHAVLALLGAVLAHGGANLLSEYFDFTSGIDNALKQGGSGLLVKGLVTPREVLIEAFVFFAAAGAIAIYFIIALGAGLVPIVALGLVCGAFYAIPRLGFKYLAVGELIVFISFGVGITTGAYFVQTGAISWTPVFYSIPFGLYVSGILFANNVRDINGDIGAGVRTLAVIAGVSASRKIYSAIVLVPYILVIAFAAVGLISAGSIVSLITCPIAVGCTKKMNSGISIADLDADTAKLSLAFGIAVSVGIVIWRWTFAAANI